jgi:hypothetical protein
LIEASFLFLFWCFFLLLPDCWSFDSFRPRSSSSFPYFSLDSFVSRRFWTRSLADPSVMQQPPAVLVSDTAPEEPSEEERKLTEEEFGEVLLLSWFFR